MAVSFADRIHALSGFDANSTSDTDTGEDFDEMAAHWMSEAVKEVAMSMPHFMIERCAKISQPFSPTDGVLVENKILNVFRTKNTDSPPSFDTATDVFICRQIPHHLAFKSADSDSLEYATATDPVYYYNPQSDGIGLGSTRVQVLPVSSGLCAKIISVDYPVFTAGDSGVYDVISATSIKNYPDEAEDLVVLKASILAANYQLAIEEDTELYLPIIASLQKQYEYNLLTLKKGNWRWAVRKGQEQYHSPFPVGQGKSPRPPKRK